MCSLGDKGQSAEEIHPPQIGVQFIRGIYNLNALDFVLSGFLTDGGFIDKTRRYGKIYQ